VASPSDLRAAYRAAFEALSDPTDEGLKLEAAYQAVRAADDAGALEEAAEGVSLALFLRLAAADEADARWPFAEIGRRFQPDVALLPIAGYDPLELRDEHLSPLDACCAFEDLNARLLIPTSYGAFPLGYEPLDAPVAWLRDLARDRDWARADAERRVAILDPGQSVHLRMRA